MCPDVLGPILLASKSDYRYIVTFIAMRSRFATIYLLRNISDVLSTFMRYYHDIKPECGVEVKVLRSDNGGEYQNAKLDRKLLPAK